MALKRGLRFLSFLFLTCVMNWGNTPIHNPRGFDKEIFRYIGRLILEGGVPYRDAFDIKPPVIFYITALGELGGIWGNWFVFSFFIALAAWIFFERFSRIHLGAAFFSIFLFLGLMCNPTISEGGGLTRILSASFALILMASIVDENNHYRDLFIGGLCALIFLTQQNEIFGLLPTVSIYFLRTKRKSASLLAMIFAGGLVTLLLCAFYMVNGAMTDLWKDAFLYNIYFHVRWEHQTLIQVVQDFMVKMREYRLLWISVTIMTLTIVLNFKNLNKRPLIAGCFLGIFLQGWAISLSHRYYAHYFHGLLPYLCVLSFYMASEVWTWSKKPTYSVLSLSSLFLGIAYFSPMESISTKINLLRAPLSQSAYLNSLPRLQSYLSNVRGRKGQFMIIRNAEALPLNIDFRIMAPNKWLTQEFMGDPKFEKMFGDFSEILDGLEEFRTRYILDYLQSSPLSNPTEHALMKNYLDANYYVVETDTAKKWRFLERKP